MSAKVIIIGNLGKNPESRINANNTFVTNFSIAENGTRRAAGGEQVERTDWFNITATGKQAQTLAEHAKKGDQLYVEGKLSFNPWVDREGNPRVSADVLVQEFRFLGSRSGGGNRNGEEPKAEGNHAATATVTRRSQTPAQTANVSAMPVVPDDLDFSGDNFPIVM